MTYAEAQRFYEQDEEKYVVLKSKDFLQWFGMELQNGYRPPLQTNDMQNMINNIVNWYEIKYPDREFDFFNGTKDLSFLDIRRLSDRMDFRQLLFRLPDSQIGLLNCGYRAHGWYLCSSYTKGHKDYKFKANLSITVDRKIDLFSDEYYPRDTIYIDADSQTGMIENLRYNDDLLELIEDHIDGKEQISVEELHTIFCNNYMKELDFSKLTSCVNNHTCDVILRKELLQLTALKMIYSRATIPEYGYERAKRFISEFNKKLDLDLTTDEIDEIMHRDYSKKIEVEPKKKPGFFRRLLRLERKD